MHKLSYKSRLVRCCELFANASSTNRLLNYLQSCFAFVLLEIDMSCEANLSFSISFPFILLNISHGCLMSIFAVNCLLKTVHLIDFNVEYVSSQNFMENNNEEVTISTLLIVSVHSMNENAIHIWSAYQKPNSAKEIL